MLNLYEDNNRRLADIVQYGAPQDIRKALLNVRNNILETIKWIHQNTVRDQRNLVLRNFLCASVPYIDLLLSQEDAPTQLLAFCTRNLYELHLQCRHVQRDEKCLKRWVAEAVTDQIEIMKGLLELDTENHAQQRKILEDAIKQKKDLLEKHSLERKKPYPTGNIATDLGKAKEKEHHSLFKIFTKLLHPTSYLVNSSVEEIQNSQIKNTLIIHIQLYAWDIIGNVRKAINFTANRPGE